MEDVKGLDNQTDCVTQTNSGMLVEGNHTDSLILLQERHQGQLGQGQQIDDARDKNSVSHNDRGGSLWGDFLSQQSQTDQSQASQQLDGVIVEGNELSPNSEFNVPGTHANSVQVCHDSVGRLSGLSTLSGSQNTSLGANISLYAGHNTGNNNQRTALYRVPDNDVPLISGLDSPTLQTRHVERLTNDVAAEPSTDIHSRMNREPETGDQFTVTTAETTFPDLKVTPNPLTNLSSQLNAGYDESPQVPCFSLGSLPAMTDDELSQPPRNTHDIFPLPRGGERSHQERLNLTNITSMLGNDISSAHRSSSSTSTNLLHHGIQINRQIIGGNNSYSSHGSLSTNSPQARHIFVTNHRQANHGDSADISSISDHDFRRDRCIDLLSNLTTNKPGVF